MCWGKPEDPERTHAATGRTMRTPQERPQLASLNLLAVRRQCWTPHQPFPVRLHNDNVSCCQSKTPEQSKERTCGVLSAWCTDWAIVFVPCVLILFLDVRYVQSVMSKATETACPLNESKQCENLRVAYYMRQGRDPSPASHPPSLEQKINLHRQIFKMEPKVCVANIRTHTESLTTILFCQNCNYQQEEIWI